MPILKPISGHSNCQPIENYLEKNGRALARDFFNLSIDERDGYDEAEKEGFRWADEMDETRRTEGNDKPHGAVAARTYKHFILSPSPQDAIDMESLRELASSWALKHFGEYQIAIVYHDDNESHIPHAHIVVNNTNLRTGRRLHTDFPMDLNRDLQKMAEKRGLSFLSDAPTPKGGLSSLASRESPERPEPKTLQAVYYGKKEAALSETGQYSWVADIRNRVSVAKSLAKSEGEFLEVLDALDVRVSANSPKAKREDWIFSLVDIPSRKVSGERLGLLFSKENLMEHFERKGSYTPTPKSAERIMRNANDAVLINDLANLDRLSEALQTCALHGVSSIEECSHRIESLKKAAGEGGDKRSERLLTEAEKLEDAREFMRENKLLPIRVKYKDPDTADKRRSRAVDPSKRQAIFAHSHDSDIDIDLSHERGGDAR